MEDMRLQQYLPLAVLKQLTISVLKSQRLQLVATVPTACGIETLMLYLLNNTLISLLQQYLPLAVLKLDSLKFIFYINFLLQQYLPLAVLKRATIVSRKRSVP